MKSAPATCYGQNMDDQPDHTPTESARFWRLNTIEALKMMPRLETNPDRFPRDEEHLAQMTANSAELKALQDRENAVKERYNRIFKKKPTP
ncbi:hypothetical protein ACH50O_23550 (plasmid) [Methylomonas sp. 2BW1-5-20]|uniref:hypothetical protein n=1 Tax=Methylomonas sp. 2BW1-5-20 TaxID=3376686 RepID=UPI004051F7E7